VTEGAWTAVRFEFAAPTQVVFGRGAIDRLGELTDGLGRRVLLVGGRTPHRVARAREALDGHDRTVTTWSVPAEPEIDAVQLAIDRARADGIDHVIGIGGGSVLDAAKAIAGMVPQPGALMDYLEVVGGAAPLATPSLPYVAIPTTAGTGSEVTRNAVLASPAHRVKVSLRSPFLFPRLAIVDPELTWDLPRELTAHTGLDALTQLIEPYLSARANPITDAICADALPRAAAALRPAVHDPRNHEAREQMALAATLSGIALTSAGLGAVHGFAAVVGGMFPAPHGAVCAALLPHVLGGNLRAMIEAGRPLRRFDELARLLTGRATAEATDAVAWTRALTADLAVAPLRAYGVDANHADAIVRKASQASSMKANPIVLSDDQLRAILLAAV
jgi:alcohol dehydrogenase class IV